MKKIIITLTLATAMCFGNAQAQSTNGTDGFFSTSTPGGNYRDGSATGDVSFFPGAPGQQIYGDQEADAPIGSGLLILAGLGLAYGLKRREK